MTEIEEQLHDAIAGVLARHERSIVTRWVCLVETVDDEGARGLWTMTSDDIMAWDTVGVLTYGLKLQEAKILADFLNGQGDDN